MTAFSFHGGPWPNFPPLNPPMMRPAVLGTINSSRKCPVCNGGKAHAWRKVSDDVAADRRRRQHKVRRIEFGDYSSETGRSESLESESITGSSLCICRRCHCGVRAAWPISGDVFKLNRSLMLNFNIVRLWNGIDVFED